MKSDKEISRVERTYLPGMRVRLLKRYGPQSPPAGTMGTIRCVDFLGYIQIAWDNISGQVVVLDEDDIEIVRMCPICGKEYTGHPAMSRRDDRTEICPDCGIKEALEAVREIYTVYSQNGDMTFIMEDSGNTTSVVGFYYGEPDEESTKEFYGKLTSEFK